MGVKKFKARTPGRRWGTVADFSEITKKSPEKSLTVSLKKSGGRNNHGRITSRGRGGGHKRKYRLIDFKYSKKGIAGTITAIEYDPNRTARIALVTYDDGDKKYIVAPVDIKVGTKIHSGPGVKIET